MERRGCVFLCLLCVVLCTMLLLCYTSDKHAQSLLALAPMRSRANWKQIPSDQESYQPLTTATRASTSSNTEYVFNFPDSTVRKSVSTHESAGSAQAARDELQHIWPLLANITFLPNYKNPCWRDDRRKIRCLPYVFLAGFPKCGTSDVYDKLIRHRDVIAPAQKEFHWWSKRRFKNVTLADYVSGFDTAATAISASTSEGDGGFHPRVTVDASPSTLWEASRLFPREALTTDPLRFLNVHLIHAALPNAKFVICVRDPVDFLWSSYMYFDTDRSKSADSFHSHVLRAMATLRQCVVDTTASLTYCMYAPLTPGRGWWRSVSNRLRLGAFHFFIQHATATAGISVHIVRLEEYSRHQKATLDRVFKFLGLSELSVSGADSSSLRASFHRIRNYNDRAHRMTMRNDTRALLERFYSSFNRELDKLIDLQNQLYDKS